MSENATGRIERELSQVEITRLLLLKGWILGEDMDVWSRRVHSDERQALLRTISIQPRPSIVARSEAELFGISTPRFAYRATILDEHGIAVGYVNLRRIKSLGKSITGRLGPDIDFDRSCHCIADSYIDPRGRWSEHILITTDLREAYGWDAPELGVPFVTHFPIGGGMCAQAVCYQATALCHKRAKGVYGVSEVTRLSRLKAEDPEDESGWLDFGGLGIEGLETYFRNRFIGLRGLRQDIRNRDVEDSVKKAQIASAIRAYVESGVPVVAAVDIASLYDGDFYPKFFMKELMPSRPEGNHSILIVGCHPDRDEFLVNDPAAFPVMPISIDVLYSSLLGQSDKWGKDPLMAIGPEVVLTPFLSTYRGENPTVRGVLQSDGVLQVDKDLESFEVTQASTTPGTDVSRFYLDSGVHGLGTMVLNEPRWISQSRISVEAYRQSRGRDHIDRAYWVKELCSETGKVRLWDAVNSSSFEPWEKCWELPSDRIDSPAGPQSPTQEPADLAQCPEELHLTPSIITSFSTRGYRDARISIDAWGATSAGRDSIPIELYVWMQSDADEIRLMDMYQVEEGQKLKNCVEIVADAACLDAIPKTIKRFGFDDQIVALATFIPEISSDPDSDRGHEAQQAMRYVCQLALALKEKSPSMRVVEIVAGCRINEVLKHDTSEGPHWRAIIGSDETSQRHLFENLRKAGSNGMYDAMKRSDISLAIELEPGPLFVLRDDKTLKQIHDRIDKELHGSLKEILGFNLDITHWRQAGISPTSNIVHHVAPRISHCHISGHHKTAHFGDRQLHPADLAEASKWLPVLAVAARSSPPTFSGLISLEFEAAEEDSGGNRLEVAESFKNLMNWQGLQSPSAHGT